MAEAGRDIQLMAVGDIMLGDSPMCYGFGVHSKIEKHGPVFPFEHVKEALNSADIAVGNLEVAISSFDDREHSFKQIQYRAQPSAVEGLKAAGFDVLSFATNHTMQHGKEAVGRSVELLHEAGIAVTGLEWPERKIANACIKEAAGRRLGFLNYNFRPQQYFIDPPLWKEPSEELVISEVQRLQKEVDLVIVCLHWGDEFIEYPSPEQVQLGRKIIDNGASIILGHHPHILQGVERYGNGVIAYSLGNFVFDMWQPRLRRSMILSVTIEPNNECRYECIPVYINKQHQPELLRGAERGAALEYIDELSSGISDDVSTVAKYRSEVERLTADYRKEVHRYYLSNLYRYKPRLLIGNFINSMRRRLGMK